jgi:hypothetical protein
MLPSLNPALLYFNLRDVFKSHARARVTYINTCDKEFPQHASWGSPAHPPDFLTGLRVTLSSACGISQAAADIAAFINGLLVDVLVDPMGWGSGHRQDVLAHSPARMQFGAIFPAAHSSEYIHYNILDARISPPEYATTARSSLTRPMLLPFYSPTQHSGTYPSDERLKWDVEEAQSRLKLLADVWSAWWSSRGGIALDAAEIETTLKATGRVAGPCDGVVMVVPAKGFKWDGELVLTWLRATADVERALLERCNGTRPLLASVAAALKLRSSRPVLLPPRVSLAVMNWTSIDSSLRNLHSLADVHGLGQVSRSHVVVLPRVDHSEYMKRSGETATLS